jgi:hypothetical protein
VNLSTLASTLYFSDSCVRHTPRQMYDNARLLQ